MSLETVIHNCLGMIIICFSYSKLFYWVPGTTEYSGVEGNIGSKLTMIFTQRQMLQLLWDIWVS